jgi:hypothetical protein
MCNTCAVGQVQFVVPVTSEELDNCGHKNFINPCSECKRPAFMLCKFPLPSLILRWKIFTPQTTHEYEEINHVVYRVRIIV